MLKDVKKPHLEEKKNENPFEFGQTYQLTGINQYKYFSPPLLIDKLRQVR